MKVELLEDWLLVRRVEREETQGGLIVPNVGKHRLVTAEVVQTGPGRMTYGPNPQFIKPSAVAGDVVVFSRYDADERENTMRLNGEELMLISDGEVIAKVLPE